MARLNLLPLICLVLAAQAAPAHAQTSERFDAGRFTFVAPSSSTVVRRTDSGVAGVDVEVRYGLHFDVTTYAWWSHYVVGTPATAREYVETDRKSEPAEQVEFAGYPAWAVTHSYPIKKRMGAGEIHVTESYLAVQRLWGYTVIRYTNDSEFFADDKPKFDSFLNGIKLLPGPVGIPILPAALILAAIGIVAMLAIKKFLARKRAVTARP